MMNYLPSYRQMIWLNSSKDIKLVMKKCCFSLLFLFWGSSATLLAQKVSYYEQLQLAEQLDNTKHPNVEKRDSIAQKVLEYLSYSPRELNPVFNLFMVRYYMGSGEYDKALQFGYKGLEQISYLPDSLDIYHCQLYAFIGLSYIHIEKYDSAYSLYQKALQVLDAEKHPGNAAHLYLELGHLALTFFENKKLAKEFLDKAANKQAFSDDTLAFNLTVNIDYLNYYSYLKKEDSIRHYALKLIELTKLVDDEIGVGIKMYAFSFLAQLSKEAGNYEEALKYHQLVLRADQEHQPIDTLKIVVSHTVIGEDYSLLNQPDSAIYHYNQAMQLVENTHFAQRKIDLLESLNAHYARRGNLEKAYEYLSERTAISDTLTRHKNDMKYNELLRQYESERQEREIDKQQEEIGLLKANEELIELRITIGIILVVVVLVIGFIIARYRVKLKERKAREVEVMGKFKESLTGMIAHDLKTPLGVILATQTERPATRQMARQMLNLVSNMLDVYKHENTEVKVQKDAHTLSTIITEAIEQVRPLSSEKNIVINMVADKENTRVLIDPEYIIRVFVNLFTNAIKYSDLNSQIEVTTQIRDDSIAISIKDQGIGIPKEKLDTIFNAFSQANSKSLGEIPSTGLGLAFCKLALKAHGSDIQVTSERGVGTTFSFDLPLTSSIPLSSANQAKIEIADRITSRERAFIHEKLPMLRTLKLHQASEMEGILTEIEKKKFSTLEPWMNELLDAAYVDNQTRYDELLAQLQTDDLVQ